MKSVVTVLGDDSFEDDTLWGGTNHCKSFELPWHLFGEGWSNGIGCEHAYERLKWHELMCSTCGAGLKFR